MWLLLGFIFGLPQLKRNSYSLEILVCINCLLSLVWSFCGLESLNVEVPPLFPAFSPYQNITVALSILDSIFHRIKLSSLMRLSSRRYWVILIQVWYVLKVHFSELLYFSDQPKLTSIGNRIFWKGLHLEVQAWQQKILLLDAGQLCVKQWNILLWTL